jgi:hypothetical protein
VEDPHLISVDELRAAGALDVPAAWRKSLGVEREPIPRMLWDDDVAADQESTNPRDSDADLAADELE